MDEYIKREAALAICEEEYREQLRILNYAGDSVAWNIGHAIKELPAADVAPVVHGRWEYIPQTLNTLSQFRCPFCRWWSIDPSIDGAYNYCPNCGAKMDEKEATYD